MSFQGLIYVVLLSSTIVLSAHGQSSPSTLPAANLKYTFLSTSTPGFTTVRPDEEYNDTRGYGWDLQSKVAAVSDGVTGQAGLPFFFSVKLPPRAYAVTLTLSGGTDGSTTTVKSESRRLMLEAVAISQGQSQERTFLVHVRVPQLPGGGSVALKARERNPVLYVQWGATLVPFTELDWDDRLTLEFSGVRPTLRALEIAPAPHPVTVYLIGDSTVTDQMMEPWAAWGQMLPRWFKPPVLIANYAESGETTASFLRERRWAKVMSEIQPGDYVFMQFGINDRGMPLEQFKKYFVRFITDTRAHGAMPVLVTSQNLKRLDQQGRGVQTLDGYPDAMRQVATEQHVAMIDLNALSMSFYQALGPATLARAFVDGTHQDDYGAYELARCVVQGVIDNHLPLAQYLTPDWRPFDPADPDPMDQFALPPDPQLDPARPNGPGAPNGQGPMAGAPTRPPTTAAAHVRH